MKKEQKKKQDSKIRRFLKLKPTRFGLMALLILLALAFPLWHRDENPLLKRIMPSLYTGRYMRDRCRNFGLRFSSRRIILIMRR